MSTPVSLPAPPEILVPLALGLVLVIFALLPLPLFNNHSRQRRLTVAVGVALVVGLLAWGTHAFDVPSWARSLLIWAPAMFLVLLPSFRRRESATE